MFGLMRARKCATFGAEKHFRRLNYCGTCKTIGAAYGVKARMLLDHDVVFMAELLSSLAGDDVDGWGRSYQSFNCFSLPEGDMPASLEWAAAANVALAGFKFADHVEDRDGARYGIARRMFSREFREAEEFLRRSGFPLREAAELLRSQGERERRAASLRDLAHPTARTTALFFSEGASVVGRPEQAGELYRLGYAFGSLAYLLDSFEDHAKDARRGSFNAVSALYCTEEPEMPAGVKRDVIATLHRLESEVTAAIERLPITDERKRIFRSRLSQNLRRKLGTQLPVVQSGKACSVRRKPAFSERWAAAVAKASELAGSYSWQMPVVFLFVLVLALAAPAGQVREARSARECFDLSFNLMFLSAVLGSVAAIPRGLFLESPPDASGGAKGAAKTVAAAAAARERKKASSEGGQSDGGCCECDCEDCCDCGECCCSCDNCGCDGCCCDCGDCCSCDC